MEIQTKQTQNKQGEEVAVNTRQPLVRAEAIAKYFDVHRRTVALWAEAGTIPCIRVGKSIRFDFDQVLATVG